MLVFIGVGLVLLVISFVLYKKKNSDGMSFLSLLFGIVGVLGVIYPVVVTQKNITSIQIMHEDLNLLVGDEQELTVEVEPKGADTQGLAWKSSDPKVVIVDDKGVIVAKSKGKATITVEAGELDDSCEVIVKQPITGIHFEKNSLNLYEGDSHYLNVELEPEDADNQEPVTWKSSNSRVITVDEKGLITAISAGDAIVYAEIGSYSDSCTVKVNNKDVGGVVITDEKTLAFEPSKLIIPLGYTQGTNIIHNGLDYNDCIWSSDDSNIASADKGVIIANNIGSTKIICENGEYVAECEVIVVDPYTYDAGISEDDINAEFGIEIVDGNTARLTFHDLVPEGTVQSQVHMHYYFGDSREESGSLADTSVNEGPFTYKNYTIIELSGNHYIYVDGEVVINGQIIKLERQRIDIK